MSKEYPRLKKGDKIACKDYKEAKALGRNLNDEGFKYAIYGTKIKILEAGKNEKKLKGNSRRNNRRKANA